MTNTAKLAKKLKDYMKAYYNEAPVVTDAEYDKLYDELMSIDPDNSVFKLVGAPVKNSPWLKEKHNHPLGSLSKVQNIDEFLKWNSNINRHLIIQEKLDGISIDLVYKKGTLTNAITRGNGNEGEDIYRNVKKMQGIFEHISELEKFETVNIRGEVLLYHSDFVKLKKIHPEYKNPRNTASGIAKRHNGLLSEYLTVQVYDILNVKELGIKDEDNALKLLIDCKLNVVKYHLFDTGINSSINKTYKKYINTVRNSINWDIDGLVVKTNIIKYDDDWKHPKNKIAIKFPHQRKPSTIIDIIWNMSGSHITPIAVFEPIDFDGVMVQKASLSNPIEAARKGVGIGAKVEITRRNDVIPYVEEVLIKGQKLEIPSECPCCQAKTEYEKNVNGDELVYLICSNDNCVSKLNRVIKKWFAAHDSKGVGDSFIEALINNDIVKNLNDLLRIPSNINAQKQIVQLNGMGEQKLNVLIDNIEKTLHTNILKFFAGLGINNAGRRIFEKIINGYSKINANHNINDIFGYINSDEINNCSGLGNIMIKTIRKFLDKNEDMINLMLDVVNIEKNEKSQIEQTFDNVSFCFTGKLNEIKRKDAEKMVKEKGGDISGVNKNLNYLVTNSPEGNTSKNKKANNLGIKIITEVMFLDMCKK